MTQTDYKTLRVPVDAWEAAKAQKEAHDRTWGEQIVRQDSELTTRQKALVKAIAERVDTDVDVSVVESAARDGAREALEGMIE